MCRLDGGRPWGRGTLGAPFRLFPSAPSRMNFFSGPNLASPDVTEFAPWDFTDHEGRARLTAVPKQLRRRALLTSSTRWSVYSPVRGLNRNAAISADNPPVAVRGFVGDYDAIQPVESVVALLNQLPPAFLPTYLETTLGSKCRLVWVFADEIPVCDASFLERLWRELAKRGRWDSALAGFDPASFKPAQRWTNGAVWYNLGTSPLAQDIVAGCAVEAGKCLSAARQEIPMDTVAAEVAKRFPGRWQGDFKLDALGVRFWDPNADSPSGCQVKPDGMLCFTGPTPFVKWREIFGPEWCDHTSAIAMSDAVDGIWFDGKAYWEQSSGVWVPYQRQDILLHIASRGLSTTKAKGQTISDAESALLHIHRLQRVDGAAPLINEPPGLVTLRGRRMLNVARVNPVLRSGKSDVNAGDFPWIWAFIQGLLPDQEALDTFLAWLRRGHLSISQHQRLMGQALFLCGPRNSGKTLLSLRICVPVLGGTHSNPYEYLVGNTAFTDDLFSVCTWAINDEDAPNDGQRTKFLAKLKASVVNPEHTYHPKFLAKTQVSWQGRIIVTLNEDPASVAILPEVNSNTADKMMFFKCCPPGVSFPPNAVLEAMIEAELPHFVEFLLQWEPPDDVVEESRVGVKSYFDPEVLSTARHQHVSHNVVELLDKWCRTGIYWSQEGTKEWVGSATDLLADLSICDSLANIVREWKVAPFAKRLTELTRLPGSGVEFADEQTRTFRVLPR